MKAAILAMAWAALALGCSGTPEPVKVTEEEITRLIGQLYHLQTGPRREAVIEELLCYGQATRSVLRRLARETGGSRTALDIADVAARVPDEPTAQILTDRLLDPADKLSPGYVGAAIVTIKGPSAHQDFKKLALDRGGPVRVRMIKALGYSGYVTEHDPVPVLYELAGRFSGDEKKLASHQIFFALSQRGQRVSEPADLRMLAGMLLPWMLDRPEGNRGGAEALGKRPAGLGGLKVTPPFGLAFGKLSGGYTCYTLSDAGVRPMAYKDLNSSLHVQVNRRGDFAAAAFSFDQPQSRRTTVDVLFRRAGKGWKYAGHQRVSTHLICLW